jgi:hypothetical protein
MNFLAATQLNEITLGYFVALVTHRAGYLHRECENESCCDTCKVIRHVMPTFMKRINNNSQSNATEREKSETKERVRKGGKSVRTGEYNQGEYD